jgi:hypothetical protein
MKLPEIRQYEMLVRVHDFGAAHGDLFPASSLEGKTFAAVGSSVAVLSQEAAAQVSGRAAAREGTSSKAAARETLRDTLDAISRTARALALDTTGLDDKFRVPRGHSDQRLLNAAHAFAQDAQPLSAAFVAHRLPATFLTDLNADIEEFEQANQHHSAGREAQGAARAALEAALAAGLTAVYRLDAIVPNTLRDDPAVLAAWGIARHVEQTPRHRANAAPPAPQRTTSDGAVNP